MKRLYFLHKRWCKLLQHQKNQTPSLVVYLSLSSSPHVSFVPRHTWPSDYCRFCTTLSGPINWTCQGAEHPVLRTFTPLWPIDALVIVAAAKEMSSQCDYIQRPAN